jgi:arginine exporter protein ArgO
MKDLIHEILTTNLKYYIIDAIFLSGLAFFIFYSFKKMNKEVKEKKEKLKSK